MKKVGFESEKVFIVSIRLRCSNKLFSRPEKEFFFVVNNNSRRNFLAEPRRCLHLLLHRARTLNYVCPKKLTLTRRLRCHFKEFEESKTKVGRLQKNFLNHLTIFPSQRYSNI